MLRYCLTIFVSAFLLFQVQPLMAKVILPWYGGTAAVWTTCLMFFQTTLVLGYAYAHALHRWLTPRQAFRVHATVLSIAAMTINLQPDRALAPTGDQNLTWSIVALLAMTVGTGFFALSATGPLIQSWQASTHAQESPWRLYALSNFGSLLALPTYPFIFERWLTLEQQTTFWRISFWGFALLCVAAGWQLRKQTAWHACEPDAGREVASEGGVIHRLLWIVLAMAASMILLASTNLMCQEIASFPFLWILPLALYLISLIICFERPGWYRRDLFSVLLICSSFLGIALLHLNVFAGLLLQIAGLSTLCFAGSMVCHGELVRLRPNVQNLTGFYLRVSIGGALGGIFVAVIAPRLFNGFYEFHVALLLCLLVPLLAGWLGTANSQPAESNENQSRVGVSYWIWLMSVLCAAAFVVSSLVFSLTPAYHPDLRFQGRNEYGLVAVRDRDSQRFFFHGRIEHGSQSLEPDKLLAATGYYTANSGAGLAFRAMQDRHPEGLKIGVIGLGAGGMVAWTRPQDELVFYELSPLVEQVAREYFDFLKQSPASTEVILGDGRIQLERQLDQNGSQPFDLLFMDAFSSDSIPVHLLTDECFDLYFQHLKPDGMLVAHITNRFIDLRPVIHAAATRHGIEPTLIDYHPDQGPRQTRWVLMTTNEELRQSPLLQAKSAAWPSEMQQLLWTDDNASLAPLIDWSAAVDWNSLRQHHREDPDSQK